MALQTIGMCFLSDHFISSLEDIFMIEFFLLASLISMQYGPTASPVAQWQRIHLPSRKDRFNPWVRKITWRKEWLPIPVFLPGKSHG